MPFLLCYFFISFLFVEIPIILIHICCKNYICISKNEDCLFKKIKCKIINICCKNYICISKNEDCLFKTIKYKIISCSLSVQYLQKIPCRSIKEKKNLGELLVTLPHVFLTNQTTCFTKFTDNHVTTKLSVIYLRSTQHISVFAIVNAAIIA